MKVCFIGGAISKAINGEVVGGAEKQQAIIILGLKAMGVDIVVLEYNLKEYIEINGISFYPAWGVNKNNIAHKINGIKNQIKKHNIKIIYARGTQIYAAIIFFYLKLKRSKIKLFWGIAGDHDLTWKYNYLRIKQEPTIYGKLNAGIIFNLSSLLLFYFSDRIICQTKEQLKRCETISKYRSTILISNIYTRVFNFQDNFSMVKKADAIWVGKFSGVKGEDILLKIAQEIPHMRVICLGHVSNHFRTSKLFQQLKKQENLIFIGRVKYHEIGNFILKADFVLNTSPSEGLSNVFLEGWDLEKPVVSYKVNPNQYLTEGKAGYCADGSFEKFKEIIMQILSDKKTMINYGQNGKKL